MVSSHSQHSHHSHHCLDQVISDDAFTSNDADEAPSAMIFTASLIHMMDGGEAEAEANHR